MRNTDIVLVISSSQYVKLIEKGIKFKRDGQYLIHGKAKVFHCPSDWSRDIITLCNPEMTTKVNWIDYRKDSVEMIVNLLKKED